MALDAKCGWEPQRQIAWSWGTSGSSATIDRECTNVSVSHEICNIRTQPPQMQSVE